MAPHAAQALAAAGRQRAQRDALVQLHVVADDGRLADDHAGAVVDAEVLADSRPRRDVDARARMRQLAHDARDDRHAFLV